MRQSKLHQPVQAQPGKTFSGGHAARRIRGEAKAMESAVQKSDRILLALRHVRVRADSVIRKRTWRGRRPAAWECEENAGSSCTDRKRAERWKSAKPTVRLERCEPPWKK